MTTTLKTLAAPKEWSALPLHITGVRTYPGGQGPVLMVNLRVATCMLQIQTAWIGKDAMLLPQLGYIPLEETDEPLLYEVVRHLEKRVDAQADPGMIQKSCFKIQQHVFGNTTIISDIN